MTKYRHGLIRIKKILRENPLGMSITEISQLTTINRNSVAKYLEVMLTSEQVEMKRFGPAKVFFISHKIPVVAMLNFSSDYIILFNNKFKVLQINQAFLNFLNNERNSIVDNTLKELSHPIFHHEAIILGLVNGSKGIESSTELSFQNDVVKYYFKSKFIPTKFEDGEQGITIIMENITTRKQIEKKLLESEKRYRQLFEGIVDAVMVYSSQGKFLDCNNVALQMYDYTKEEFFKLTAADIVHPDYYQLMKKNLKKNWNGEASIVESLHCTKDGKNIPVEVNAHRIEYGGKYSILAVIRDITERKKREKK